MCVSKEGKLKFHLKASNSFDVGASHESWMNQKNRTIYSRQDFNFLYVLHRLVNLDREVGTHKSVCI